MYSLLLQFKISLRRKIKAVENWLHCSHCITLVLCQNRGRFQQPNSQFLRCYPVLFSLSLMVRLCKLHEVKHLMIFRGKVIWRVDYYFRQINAILYCKAKIIWLLLKEMESSKRKTVRLFRKTKTHVLWFNKFIFVRYNNTNRLQPICFNSKG